MGKQNSTYENAAIRICLDGKDKFGIYGTVHSPYWDEKKSFRDTVQMLLHIEALVQGRAYPKPMFNMRTFVGAESGVQGIDGNVYRTKEQLSKEYGTAETLLVYVTKRRYAGLQGHVLKLSSGKIYKYESELQLLQIMEEQIVPFEHIQKKAAII